MRNASEPPQVDVLNEKLGVTWDWSYGTRDADKTIKPVKVDAVGKMSADGNNGWTVIMPIRELEKIQKEKQAWEPKAKWRKQQRQSPKVQGISACDGKGGRNGACAAGAAENQGHGLSCHQPDG